MVKARLHFFSPADNRPAGSDLVRYMADWPESWDEQLRQLMPTTTNCAIAKQLGATAGLVGFRIQKLGLKRTQEEHDRLYSAIQGRLKMGVNEINQQPPGTLKWVHKHPKRPGTKPEWWIFLGKGERMPFRRWLWQTWVGPIPKGYSICFADGNTRRCILPNLICMETRKMPSFFRNQIKAAMQRRAYWLTPAAKKSNQKRVKSMLVYWRTPEGQQTIANRSEKMRQMNQAGLINNPFRNLHDSAVAHFITQDPILKEMVKQSPDLLALKRAEILLKRELKKQSIHEPASN